MPRWSETGRFYLFILFLKAQTVLGGGGSCLFAIPFFGFVLFYENFMFPSIEFDGAL